MQAPTRSFALRGAMSSSTDEAFTTPPRVLVVDDDVGTACGFSAILRYAGFAVSVAGSGAQALARLSVDDPDAILVDLQLPDMSGLEVVRQVPSVCPLAATIVVTGFGSPTTAVEAMRLGAVDYVEKPLIDEDLTRVVIRGLARAREAGRVRDRGTIRSCRATRWVQVLIPAITADTDPSTVARWSRCAGMSRSALKARCQAVGVSAKHSLSIARLLRAIHVRSVQGITPSDSLDIIDRLTTIRLLTRAGVPSGDLDDLPEDVHTFLATQTFVRGGTVLSELLDAVIRLSRSMQPEGTR